jgi:putative aldouronate transport system substrate-binding protein
MKKLLAIVLAMVMMVSFASCGGTDADIQETDLSKPITLNWIMPGPGVQTDSEMVWANFNEELKKIKGFENVTVNIEVIPVADYKQKVMLMQTSGEKMDLLQTYQLDYAREYRNGTIQDIAPYLEKFAKETFEELPQWVIDMGKVDGAQAILPNYQKMVAAPYYSTIPADLAQYADIEAMSESFMSDKKNNYVPSEKSIALVEDYLSKVEAAGKLGKGYAGIWQLKGTEAIIDAFRYYYTDPEYKVNHSHLIDQQIANWRVKKYFFDKGYVRKDALSAKAADFNGVKDGNVAWTSQNWTGKLERFDGDKTHDIDVVQFPASDHFFIPYKPAAGGFAVPVNSEYPDVAVKLINLLSTKEGIELYNMLVYGIEGVHYTVDKVLEDGDKMITPKDYAEEGNSSSSYGLWKWIVGNAKNAYITSNQPENFKEIIYEQMNEGELSVVSPLMGFALDATTIETKLGQIKAVGNEFGGPLGSGAVDTEKLLEEMFVKYEQAGVKDVCAVIQEQVDAFIASK